MTSPHFSSTGFHPRPGFAPVTPPRHVIYACSNCKRRFSRWRNLCLCHPSQILHGVEVSQAEYDQIKAHES